MPRGRHAFKAASNLAHRGGCVNACELGVAEIVAAVALTERGAVSLRDGPACEVAELRLKGPASGDRARRAAFGQAQP